MMNQKIEPWLRELTQAESVEELGVLQSLWSGYGSIVRYRIVGASMSSLIVKHVSPPNTTNHPRGWNTDISHQRKLKSYEVETAWYRHWASRCGAGCRVPHCLQVLSEAGEVVMVMEDLDAAGYPVRKSSVTSRELASCLSWLAHFHATFLGEHPQALWHRGTYWHLETRPDELQVLANIDPELYAIAESLDTKLRASRFQTLVHGDAKLANFCFSQDEQSVAAVDFQYVGAGCGMQDLAYFIGSCLDEEACAQQEEALLQQYFSALREALVTQGKQIDANALERDWRALYPVAWTDFHRFLKGWSPEHWKIHSYSERLARQVIAQIQQV